MHVLASEIESGACEINDHLRGPSAWLPLSPKFNVDKLAIADGGFFTKMVIFFAPTKRTHAGASRTNIELWGQGGVAHHERKWSFISHAPVHFFKVLGVGLVPSAYMSAPLYCDARDPTSSRVVCGRGSLKILGFPAREQRFI